MSLHIYRLAFRYNNLIIKYYLYNLHSLFFPNVLEVIYSLQGAERPIMVVSNGTPSA